MPAEPHSDPQRLEVLRRLEQYADGGPPAPTPPDAPPAVQRAARLIVALEELSLLATDPAGDVPRERFGHFRIVAPLGSGGLAQVFLAEDERLQRLVALKVLRRREYLDEDTLAWLENEGRSIARLRHEGIARILDIGQFEGQPYLSMELVEGPSLHSVLRRMRTGGTDPDPRVEARAQSLASIAERCTLIARAARALHHCHANGVVHRDIKPSNILLDDLGRPVLIDFGLALMRGAEGETARAISERLVGTPAYLAPEQVDSARTGSDARSDQFALGVVLYELLALRHPFDMGSRDPTLAAISRCAPPPPRGYEPRIAHDLERIVLHALERDPARRYPSLEALAADLEAFVERRAISLSPPSLLNQLGASARRYRRRLLAGGLAVFAAAAGGLGATAWATRQERDSLLERLEAPRAAAMRPDDCLAALQALEALGNQVRMYRERRMLSSLHPFPDDALTGALDELDRRVAVHLLAARSEARTLMQPFDLGGWHAVLEELHRLRPTPSPNDVDRRRERLSLSPQLSGLEHRLFAARPSSALAATTLTPIPWSELPGNGEFRWLALDPQTQRVVHEREFAIRPDDLERRLEPSDESYVDPTTWVEFDVPEALVRERLSPALGNAPEVPLDPDRVSGSKRFAVMRRLVTWRELRAFVQAHPEQRAALAAAEAQFATNPAALAEDQPASSSFELARAFASASNARLPSSVELYRCELDASVERPSPDGPAKAELTCWIAPHRPDLRTVVWAPLPPIVAGAANRAQAHSARTKPMNADVSAFGPGHSPSALGFRLARTLEPCD